MAHNHRLIWVDIARGIGILFIILTHMPINRNLIAYNCSFQLGIFFFFSGYLFHISNKQKSDLGEQKCSDFKIFLISRIKGILVPYLSLSLISMIFYLFYYHVPFYSIITFKDMLSVFLFGARNTIFYNIPLWFLPTLFLVECLYYFLQKYCNKDIIILCISLLLSCFSFIWLNALYQTKVFWTWPVALYYLIYFTIGNLARKYIKENTRISIFNINGILFILCLLLNISMYYFPDIYFSVLSFQTISLHSIKLYFTALLIMLAGTYVYIYISRILANKFKHIYFLEYLGRNSLIFFGLHIPVMWCIRSLFQYFNISITSSFNLIGIVYAFLTILILWPISYLINKYCPWIIGKYSNNKSNNTKVLA